VLGSPIPSGFVCINVDAALFAKSKSMGWGSVVWDHKSTFLLSCSEGVPGFLELEMAQAVAARNALAMVKDRGFSKVVLVSDCLSGEADLGNRRDRSTLGAVIVDIKSLKTDFESCYFIFSSHVTNVVEHKLAYFESL
jgi:hypothetical protein